MSRPPSGSTRNKSEKCSASPSRNPTVPRKQTISFNQDLSYSSRCPPQENILHPQSFSQHLLGGKPRPSSAKYISEINSRKTTQIDANISPEQNITNKDHEFIRKQSPSYNTITLSFGESQLFADRSKVISSTLLPNDSSDEDSTLYNDYESNELGKLSHLKSRRIQSAKGRLENPAVGQTNNEQSPDPGRCQEGGQLSIHNIKQKRRPSSAKESVKISDNVKLTRVRPASAKEYKKESECAYSVRIRPSSAKAAMQHVPEFQDDLSPSVYGLRRQRKVSGSCSDVNDTESYPYKLSVSKGDNIKTMSSLPPKQTRKRMHDHQESDKKRYGRHGSRVVSCGGSEITGSIAVTNRTGVGPSCLHPLLPWLLEDDMSCILGVPPGLCMAFVPSVHHYAPDLSEAPPPQQATDQLVYREQLLCPEPWAPRKYPHPFKRESLEEWTCHHTSSHLPDYISPYKQPKSKQSINDFRQEVVELENLMMGLGCEDSDCSMVRYQADITRLKEMLDATLVMIPDRLKEASPEPIDSCDADDVNSDYDLIMNQIREQHHKCVSELAILEQELGFDPEFSYFNKLITNT